MKLQVQCNGESLTGNHLRWECKERNRNNEHRKSFQGLFLQSTIRNASVAYGRFKNKNMKHSKQGGRK